MDTDIRAAVWTRGPTQLTWAVASAYRSRALALIPSLTADRDATGALAALVPHL